MAFYCLIEMHPTRSAPLNFGRSQLPLLRNVDPWSTLALAESVKLILRIMRAVGFNVYLMGNRVFQRLGECRLQRTNVCQRRSTTQKSEVCF
jgi:hypothetical protein